MIRGVFASHSGIVGDRVQDLSSRILQLGYTGTAPLLALSSGMAKESARDTAFSWIEDQHVSGNTKAVGNVNSAASQFVVADSNIWTVNTVIMNQTTGEHMLITNITGNTITVERGITGTSPDSITNNDVIQSIGTAYAEGSGRPEAVAQRGETRTNYVQIFKNGWAITGTATRIGFTTGSQMAMNRQQCMLYHAEDIERAFWFGKPGVMIRDNKQLRLSAGIVHQIETYGGRVVGATDGSTPGNMNMKNLQNFLRLVFDRNVKGLPNERIAFTGSAVVELVNEMARLDSTYNIAVNESEYGIKIMKLTGFNGSINLMTHPLMTENTLWGKNLYVLHPGLIKKRELRDTWTQEFSWENNSNNGIDATEGFIAVELGFQLQGAECHGILEDISAAVASHPSQ